ncbi:hypothetical protein LCGC14_1800010 [marine sediment metagenome]|uniref:Uncharacterized protein n=1 Tax=marine sediment metagenome TaxID=412755 RepID=A0A0F9GPS8_9ZZZZ
MEGNTSLKKEEDGESIISKIIDKKVYEVNFEGFDLKDKGKRTMDVVFWVDEWSQNIIYKLSKIIQSEVSFINIFIAHQDKDSGLKDLLFQRFHRDFMKNKDLEESLVTKIKELEEYKFQSPKSLYENYKIIKDGLEIISFNELNNMILSLRERRIKIYKTLLNEFNKNKEKYLDYMKSRDYTYI